MAQTASYFIDHIVENAEEIPGLVEAFEYTLPEKYLSFFAIKGIFGLGSSWIQVRTIRRVITTMK